MLQGLFFVFGAYFDFSSYFAQSIEHRVEISLNPNDDYQICQYRNPLNLLTGILEEKNYSVL